MIYVLAGVVAHILVQVANVPTSKRIPLARPLAWVAGWSMWVFSIYMGATDPDKVQLPDWTAWSGWALLLVSGSFMAYSMFVSLPAVKTYLYTKTHLELVTRGVYSLVRHPWILGYVPFMFALLLISQSRLMLIEAPLFASLGVLGAVIQDKFIFSHVFAGYDKYSSDTPMLIPNRKSLTTFVDSFRFSRNHVRHIDEEV